MSQSEPVLGEIMGVLLEIKEKLDVLDRKIELYRTLEDLNCRVTKLEQKNAFSQM